MFFSDTDKDLKDMSFEKAKKLAGSTNLDSNFILPSAGPAPRFGIISLPVPQQQLEKNSPLSYKDKINSIGRGW
ncbi:MAG: hypothetical protein QM752_00375 [Gammaproteobacteria bacterium]